MPIGQSQVPFFPVAERLAQLQAERDNLVEQLADLSLELDKLRAELAQFRASYLKRLGRLLLELEQLETALARCHAPHQDVAAQAVFAVAELPAEAEEEILPSAPELKQAYRKVVSILHPDRAADEADAILRNQLMAVANQALRVGDRMRLEQLLDEYALRRPPPHHAPPEMQLAQLERQIAHLQRQLGALRAERNALQADALYRLMDQMQLSESQSGDPWQKIAGELRLRVQMARRLLGHWMQQVTPSRSAMGVRTRTSVRPATRRRRVAPRPPARYHVQEGISVRSAAELLIAQTLTQAGLGYVYEYLPPGETEPLGGFVIWDSQRQMRVWEHAGPDWPARLKRYLQQGLRPGVSLFVTHDEPHGGLDLRQFRRVVHYLLGNGA